MGMRRILVCAAITLPLLTVVPTDEAMARLGGHAGCQDVKHALVADARAEVYEVEREYFACAYSGGRTYALGSRTEGTPEGGGGVDPSTIEFAGATVAYEEFEVRTEGVSFWRVIVRDLRSGR